MTRRYPVRPVAERHYVHRVVDPTGHVRRSADEALLRAVLGRSVDDPLVELHDETETETETETEEDE